LLIVFILDDKKTIFCNNKSLKNSTSIISPVGNLIGRTTSEGMLEFSLQWMSVSSRSNTSVFFPEE
jgi:hypothetical protein